MREKNSLNTVAKLNPWGSIVLSRYDCNITSGTWKYWCVGKTQEVKKKDTNQKLQKRKKKKNGVKLYQWNFFLSVNLMALK